VLSIEANNVTFTETWSALLPFIFKVSFLPVYFPGISRHCGEIPILFLRCAIRNKVTGLKALSQYTIMYSTVTGMEKTISV
jgi:hypothetical protein